MDSAIIIQDLDPISDQLILPYEVNNWFAFALRYLGSILDWLMLPYDSLVFALQDLGLVLDRLILLTR